MAWAMSIFSSSLIEDTKKSSFVRDTNVPNKSQLKVFQCFILS